jgi:hypothetical protein
MATPGQTERTVGVIIGTASSERGCRMSAIRGTYRNGQVILDGPPPADWKDGTEVWLEPVDPASGEDDPDGLLGSDPESIARWLTWYESLKPYRMSDEDDAEFRRVLQEHKEWELANQEARSKKIRDLFQ